MALPEDDRRALSARLAPAGGHAADVVADAVDDGEELREILVDAQGDVVAFTNKRALFVADGAEGVVAVEYAEVEVRKRDAGLAIDALIEGGRLILEVAKGTFVRLAVVGSGGPPGRASWLPVRTPPARTVPAPAPMSSPSSFVPVSPAPVPGAAPPAPVAPSLVAPTPAPPPAIRPPASAASPAPTPTPTPAPPQAQRHDLASPMTSAPPMASPPPMPPPGTPPPGWHPDPSGRHWWRWWDGLDWTEYVADGGSPTVDPLPPR